MCDAVQRHPIDPVYPYTTLFRSREARGAMGGDLGETRGRDRAGSARLGEDDFGGVRKELAGDLVDRLIAERSIDERSEEHTSELQSRFDIVCRLLLEKKNPINCH